jgi:hypothetical protein
MTKTERELIAREIDSDNRCISDMLKIFDIISDKNELAISLITEILQKSIKRLESLRSEKEEK